MNENDSLPPPAPLALRGVNVSEALARFAGSEERLRHWLQDFCHYGPDTACQIRTAIDTGAHDQAIRLAHACIAPMAMSSFEHTRESASPASRTRLASW